MNLVTSYPKTQQYATRKDISRIFCYKDPTILFKDFREYADLNEQKFFPHKPCIKKDLL